MAVSGGKTAQIEGYLSQYGFFPYFGRQHQTMRIAEPKGDEVVTPGLLVFARAMSGRMRKTARLKKKMSKFFEKELMP